MVEEIIKNARLSARRIGIFFSLFLEGKQKSGANLLHFKVLVLLFDLTKLVSVQNTSDIHGRFNWGHF